mmetsp:Transcript_5443/g.20326  ORF Transcript_5443/g.20326 Transcript_5443/m.20326 type:complete len:693 (-) Transcript_5443:121-2199(-)|eukprot:CAMPEP_0117447422 /NCGR_PEP_ID=MMETSP0759-20121206/6867_1 /TAXON_ID=63605 /ORGANISM="Percolomonas cosmopolitus, Strain WS" /LENGTH=692 /DNA_ID=CAMNT_0005239757 /DNA_START=218 /DNA_END=2296 /DNA_ORIENTATION=+
MKRKRSSSLSHSQQHPSPTITHPSSHIFAFAANILQNDIGWGGNNGSSAAEMCRNPRVLMSHNAAASSNHSLSLHQQPFAFIQAESESSNGPCTSEGRLFRKMPKIGDPPEEWQRQRQGIDTADEPEYHGEAMMHSNPNVNHQSTVTSTTLSHANNPFSIDEGIESDATLETPLTADASSWNDATWMEDEMTHGVSSADPQATSDKSMQPFNFPAITDDSSSNVERHTHSSGAVPSKCTTAASQTVLSFNNLSFASVPQHLIDESSESKPSMDIVEESNVQKQSAIYSLYCQSYMQQSATGSTSSIRTVPDLTKHLSASTLSTPSPRSSSSHTSIATTTTPSTPTAPRSHGGDPTFSSSTTCNTFSTPNEFPHYIQRIINEACTIIRQKLTVISKLLDAYIDEFRNFIVTLTPSEAKFALYILQQRKRKNHCQCKCVLRNEIQLGSEPRCDSIPDYVVDSILICWIRMESLNDFDEDVVADVRDLLTLCDHTLTKCAKAFILYTWGCLHFARDESCDAMKCYASCIESDPTYFVAHIDRAIILTENFSRPTDAIECLTQAIKVMPDVARLYADRGCIHAGGCHDEQSALKDFCKSIELDPTNPDVYNNRGALLVDLHRYEEALEDFNRSISLDSSCSVAFFNRGLAQNHLNNVQEALLDFKRSLEIYSCPRTKHFFFRAQHKVAKMLCIGNI